MSVLCQAENSRGVSKVLRLADNDNNLVTISTQHYKVHIGSYFTANYLEKAVASNGFMKLLVKTGAESAHLDIYVASEGKAYFKTIASPTITDEGVLPDGVKLTSFNRRGGTNSQDTIVKHTPVYTGGTLRGNRLIIGGTGGTAIGSTSNSRIESIISPNTTFVIELQNVSGQARDMEIVLDWYEEVPPV